MSKVIHRSRAFELYSANRRNPNKRGIGPKYYTIRPRRWFSDGDLQEIRNMLDPNNNKGTTRQWVYKNLEEAQKQYTMLTLRWV